MTIKSAKLVSIQSIRQSVLACICATAIYGCSGSSDSGPGEIVSVNESTVISEPQVGAQSTPVETESSSQATTRVNFDITVPAYMSDELQVRLSWGDIDTTAAWVRDENWVVSENFSVDTENPLVVTFSDRNGALTLGSFESNFRTGTGATQSFQISADQFETERWDSDADGVSNLDELIAGRNPGGNDPLQPVRANLELVPDKTFRISWQSSAAATFYRVLENKDGISGFSQISDDLDPTTLSYDHRVALYSRTNASYIVQACNDSMCVNSDEQLVSGSLESAIGYFKSGNADATQFGNGVSLSADGETMAVFDAGVSIFSRNNSVWQQQDHFSADDFVTRGARGFQLQLSADGNTLVAQGVDKVYVYIRTNSEWREDAVLTASNADQLGDFENDDFGSSLSVSADGLTIAVGDNREDSGAVGINGEQNDNSISNAGAVYIFTRGSVDWVQQAYIKSANTRSNEQFGQSVSLNANGNWLAVGVSMGDSTYIFERIGDNWQQQAFLNLETRESFGFAVSLNSQGDTLAVGAITNGSGSAGIDGVDSDSEIVSSGAVYVFVRTDSIWEQQAFLKASNPDVRDAFGLVISLSASGDTLAVGTNEEDSSARGLNGDQLINTSLPFSVHDFGAAYIFQRMDGTWQQEAYVKASNTERDEDFCIAIDDNGDPSFGGDSFATSLSLSADGETLAVGAFRECSAATTINGDQDDNSLLLSGAVYLY